MGHIRKRIVVCVGDQTSSYMRWGGNVSERKLWLGEGTGLLRLLQHDLEAYSCKMGSVKVLDCFASYNMTLRLTVAKWAVKNSNKLAWKVNETALLCEWITCHGSATIARVTTLSDSVGKLLLSFPVKVLEIRHHLICGGVATFSERKRWLDVLDKKLSPFLAKIPPNWHGKSKSQLHFVSGSHVTAIGPLLIWTVGLATLSDGSNSSERRLLPAIHSEFSGRIANCLPITSFLGTDYLGRRRMCSIEAIALQMSAYFQTKGCSYFPISGEAGPKRMMMLKQVQVGPTAAIDFCRGLSCEAKVVFDVIEEEEDHPANKQLRKHTAKPKPTYQLWKGLSCK
ncbi:hypothetical protein E3N88_37032 [Mikania micrantha]|uniref:Uncharacterized protein n=1 Tax=Mikania micrantha TaxID=192012 RepID=A0A5N6M5X7_9ASTR|nr:hypothetical protein E3N88_37032 [Mikania micrantha]